jgi:hypothetical protein
MVGSDSPLGVERRLNPLRAPRLWLSGVLCLACSTSLASSLLGEEDRYRKRFLYSPFDLFDADGQKRSAAVARGPYSCS